MELTKKSVRLSGPSAEGVVRSVAKLSPARGINVFHGTLPLDNEPARERRTREERADNNQPTKYAKVSRKEIMTNQGT